MIPRSLVLTVLLASSAAGVAQEAKSVTPHPETSPGYFVYVGSYTHPTPSTASAAKGIYGFRFDPATAALTPIGLVAETINPAHVWPSSDGRFLYAVNWQTGDKVNGDTVSAFSIDQKTGHLAFLNKVSSHGESPNQVVLDPSGKVAVTVTFKGGTATALPVESDGRLGEAFYSALYTAVPSGPRPHTHGVIFSKDGSFVFVAELGLDRVYSYRLDAARRTMTPSNPPYVELKSGSGPRRLQLHPNGRFLYVNLESKSGVNVYAVNGGNLTEIQSLSTLPADFQGRNTTAEIQIDQSGRFLYVSNRGHDSIATYTVDPATGMLTFVECAPSLGKTPRNLKIDPTNQYLFVGNQDGENIVVFRIDPASGRLTPANIQVPSAQPGGIAFVKSGS